MAPRPRTALIYFFCERFYVFPALSLSITTEKQRFSSNLPFTAASVRQRKKRQINRTQKRETETESENPVFNFMDSLLVAEFPASFLSILFFYSIPFQSLPSVSLFPIWVTLFSLKFIIFFPAFICIACRARCFSSSGSQKFWNLGGNVV